MKCRPAGYLVYVTVRILDLYRNIELECLLFSFEDLDVVCFIARNYIQFQLL